MKIVGGSIRIGIALRLAAACAVALLFLCFTGEPARGVEGDSAGVMAGSAYTPIRPASSAASTSSAGSTLRPADPSAGVRSSSGTGVASAAAEPISSKTETVVVPAAPGPGAVPSVSSEDQTIPPATTEIPQAQPENSGALTPPASGQIALSGGQIVNYQQTQNPAAVDPQIGSLQDFITEDNESSPLGVELRESRRRLDSGEEADGLLIVAVTSGSPAAKAGLRAYRRRVQDILQGAAVAGAFVFPPAILAVPLLDQIHVGESYDMIIGVDGSRVTNFLDFEDRLREMQPGEIVYFSIVRNGRRMQVPVDVPSTMPSWTF